MPTLATYSILLHVYHKNKKTPHTRTVTFIKVARALISYSYKQMLMFTSKAFCGSSSIKLSGKLLKRKKKGIVIQLYLSICRINKYAKTNLPFACHWCIVNECNVSGVRKVLARQVKRDSNRSPAAAGLSTSGCSASQSAAAPPADQEVAWHNNDVI